MKTTVEYSKVSFKDERPVVKCNILVEVQLYRIQNMEHLVQIPSVAAYLSKYMDKKGRILVPVSAQARCAEGDEFDYETGRRIAFTKAQADAFWIVSDILDEIMRRAVEDTKNTSDNCVLSAMKCTDHYYKLCGNTGINDPDYE